MQSWGETCMTSLSFQTLGKGWQIARPFDPWPWEDRQKSQDDEHWFPQSENFHQTYSRVTIRVTRSGNHKKTKDRFPHSKFSKAHNHVTIGIYTGQAYKWSLATLLSWSSKRPRILVNLWSAPNTNCNNCLRSRFIKTIFLTASQMDGLDTSETG